MLLEDEKNVIACEKNVDGGCCVVTRAALRAAPTDWWLIRNEENSIEWE